MILDVEVGFANGFLSNVVIPPFFEVCKHTIRDFFIDNVHVDHDKALFAVAVANAEHLQMVDRSAFRRNHRQTAVETVSGAERSRQ